MHDLNKIEILRKQKKVTQQELAEGCGFTRNGFSKMIEIADPKVSTIQAIADYFNVPITYFFEDVAKSENDAERSIDEVFEAMKELVKSKILK